MLKARMKQLKAIENQGNSQLDMVTKKLEAIEKQEKQLEKTKNQKKLLLEQL